jgi:hypothetical protein
MAQIEGGFSAIRCSAVGSSPADETTVKGIFLGEGSPVKTI